MAQRNLKDGRGMESATAAWDTALQALEGNKSVGFPTETVWGLGGAATLETAVNRLSLLKGRDRQKAIQVSCLDINQAYTLVQPHQPVLEKLMALLPGPLTLVAWASSDCPAWLQFEGKVGLRIPNHPTVQELLRRFGGPLATTSLNPAGQPPATTWEQAQAYGLANVLLPDLYPDLYPQQGLPGLSSTVVDCTNSQILRQGAISAEQIKAVLGQH